MLRTQSDWRSPVQLRMHLPLRLGCCETSQRATALNDVEFHEAGGDVLKLIGDGTLAVFQADDAQEPCRSALRAHCLARDRLETLNTERRARRLPTTTAYLGLHVGEVFHGNIGSRDRLDFTAVGPAV